MLTAPKQKIPIKPKTKRRSGDRSPVPVHANCGVDNYRSDWRQSAIATEMDGYHVLLIPKSTILYKGVRVQYPDAVIPEDAYFYSTLETALFYAG